MKQPKTKVDPMYRPVPFLLGVFSVTWLCTILMTAMDYNSHPFLFSFLDFLENASPLICALLLLQKPLLSLPSLTQFLLGTAVRPARCLAVFFLFAAQFLNFYCFRSPEAFCSPQTFLTVFIGQLLFGGGLEEAGWRGYLLPCFYRKWHILLSSTAVSLIWVFWHLPYFIFPGNLQSEQNFFSYTLIGIVTGLILTAIYLLTNSVLLCMLFHSWQNTLVMTIPADTGNPWFMLIFLLLGAVSALICTFLYRPRHSLLPKKKIEN
ncbi:MAG: CPBP family intramembrane metalloprotease [Lachnospiraceae bacterium]|nr:CPBP family intramembrane metalloprotease [Lachnospiraceae bacterium]